jgi:hypothetical protein
MGDSVYRDSRPAHRSQISRDLDRRCSDLTTQAGRCMAIIGDDDAGQLEVAIRVGHEHYLVSFSSSHRSVWRSWTFLLFKKALLG